LLIKPHKSWELEQKTQRRNASQFVKGIEKKLNIIIKTNHFSWKREDGSTVKVGEYELLPGYADKARLAIEGVNHG